MIKSLVSLAGIVSSISKPRDVVSHCIRLFSVISGSDKVPQEKRTIVNIDVFDWMVGSRLVLLIFCYLGNRRLYNIFDLF